ncbi:hypothetical protein Micbo1qcDRAFT_47234 [Microdochium bolleyi]|uniref:Uncharacterized protein n=1 Tax=Microdochium bolleyi TaxID=196109 RepID=A0A136ILF3_9PEZI|nr:hypothetical protein Micbo1qcDRAFT_47234 [Microdochium bolleyi]
MGFLNILLKRQRDGGKGAINEASFLKGQAYESTTASSPPILGTVPVPGNGSNPMLIAANQQQLQVQLNTGDVSSRRLPTSRLRSTTVSRPGTAVSASQSDASGRPRTSSGPSLAPKLELQHHVQARQKDGPPYRLNAKSEARPYELPPKPWLELGALKRNSLTARTSTLSSTSSARTAMTNHRSSPSLGSRSRTHVDLLDATVKPLDFYDRIKAAGAKTYGEDVADRNQSQASLALPLQAHGDAGTDDAAGPRNRQSIGYGQRTSSLRPISQLEHDPNLATRDSDLIAKRKAAKAAARRSMPVMTDSLPGVTVGPQGDAVDAVPFPQSLKEKAAAMAKNELAIIRATAAMPKSNRIRLDGTVDSSPTPRDRVEKTDHAQGPSAFAAPSLAAQRDTQPSTTREKVEHGPIDSGPQHRRKDSWKSVKQQRSRNVSGASLTVGSIKQFDLETPIPDRSSSLRNWSMTSGSITAYTHDYESNPFRPQSSHTTKTSVDLSPFSTVSKSHSPTQAFPTSPAEGASPDQRRGNPEPVLRFQTLKRSPLGPETKSAKVEQDMAVMRKPSSAEFHIDDYESSDDSFGSPKRNRGDEEKDLLFSDDAFGLTYQLPGISMPLRQEHPGLSPSTDGQTLSLSAFNDFSDYTRAPSFGQISALRAKVSQQSASKLTGSRGREYNFPVSAYHDHSSIDGDESGVDADSEDEWSMDIPMRRPAPSRHHYQTSPARQSQGPRSRVDNVNYSSPASSKPRHERHHQPRNRQAQRIHIRDY